MLGLGLLPTLGIGALILALLGGGEWWRVNDVKNETWKAATAAQQAASAKEIAALNQTIGQRDAELASSQSSLMSCKQATDDQNAKIKASQDAKNSVQAEMVKLRQQQMIKEANNRFEISKLQEQAKAAPQKDLTCEQERKQAYDILIKGLKDRRTPQ